MLAEKARLLDPQSKVVEWYDYLAAEHRHMNAKGCDQPEGLANWHRMFPDTDYGEWFARADPSRSVRARLREIDRELWALGALIRGVGRSKSIRNPHQAGRRPDPAWRDIDNEFQKHLLRGAIVAGAKQLYELVRKIAQDLTLPVFADSTIKDHFVKRFGRSGWTGLTDGSAATPINETGLGYWQKLDCGVLLAIKNGGRPQTKSQLLRLYSMTAQQHNVAVPSLTCLGAHIVETLTEGGWNKFDEADPS